MAVDTGARVALELDPADGACAPAQPNQESTSRPAPDPRVRVLVSGLMRTLDGRHGGIALTVQGSLLARIGPPTMNAAMFLSRSTLNLRFFGAMDEVADWLTPLCKVDAPTRLTSKITQMRLALDHC